MSSEEPAFESEAEYPDIEHLWEFAGQGLRSADFFSAMAHFYRAEVNRSNTWRQRLDITTNWAVITTAAALTFAFGAPTNTHLVIIIMTLLVLLFLFIEARRYRYYELWTSRVRLMETNYFVGLLSPPYRPSSEWATRVKDSLKHPQFPIGLGEAFGRRYRRNYAFLFLILAVSWVFKVLIHPEPATSLELFFQQASAGPLPGRLVLAIGVVFNLFLMLIGFLTASIQETTAEVLEERASRNILQRLGQGLRSRLWEVLELDLPLLSRLPHIAEPKQLAYIITDDAEGVSGAVMEGLGRGVTRLKGEGMFTGQEHGVLMCAFSARQANRLQKIVEKADPEAFMIVVGARDVRGEGFRPLEA